jgi:hypothetical protein
MRVTVLSITRERNEIKIAFPHGQLYVACSRVGTGKNLYVLAPNPKNIMHQKRFAILI